MLCMKTNQRGGKTMEDRNEPKLVYKLMPCPPYDVSGMECWLSEMAD